jgi:hypothetical protein
VLNLARENEIIHGLNLARENEIIHGLVPELVEGGLTHLHYANDTIVFLQHSALDIANLKFLFVTRSCLE